MPRRGVLLAALGAAWGGGCTLRPDLNHKGADAPIEAPLARRPRTAWVFSSGGPRGFVHVGVIKALDELGLVPDLIVGSSVGAFVGVLRGAGLGGHEIETLALELQPWSLARLAWGGNERLSGAAIADYLDERLQKQTGASLLQRLPVPVVCVAQRLSDRKVVGFSHGDAGLAVQAAMAVEGQFTPLRIHGQAYADADLQMPLPVRVARALGASRVLAVDASAHEDKAPEGSEPFRAGDLRKRASTRPDAELADLLLHPQIGYWAGMSAEYRQRAIRIGYQSTLAQAAKIRELHAG